MKRFSFIIAMLITLGISAGSFAQQLQIPTAPHAFKYQAVARDASGNAIANQNVSFRISILQGGTNGTTVYQETQQATTNQFGLANLNIGRGSIVSGSIDSIQWGNGSYFVKIEFDPKGGMDYTLMGTSEMLSVPYALYAEQTNFPIKAALKATNLQSPFDSPQTGMLVYNTDSGGNAPYNVVPGYYYNAGTPAMPKWVLLSTDNNSGSIKRTMVCNTYQYGNCAGNASTAPNNTGYGDMALSSVTSGSYNTANGYGALTDVTTAQGNTGIGADALSGIITGIDNTAVGVGAGQDNNYNYCTAVGAVALTLNTGDNNVAVGYEAMDANTSGTQNVAVGVNAMSGGGASNVAVGYYSLFYGAGNSNTGLGTNALYKTSANYNTGVGADVLYSNVGGADNVAEGMQSMYSNTYGGANVSSGFQALYTQSYSNSTTAYNSYNTAIGYKAMYANQPTSTSNGTLNTAVGGLALLDNTTGNFNTAIGLQAEAYNTIGIHNTALGGSAIYNNIQGSSNVAVGFSAFLGSFGDQASLNTAVGDSSMYETTGDKNVAVGYQALQSNTTGTLNTVIGYQADVGTSGLTNATAIGANASVGESNALVLGNGADVGIGTANPSALLHLMNGHIRSQYTTSPTISGTTYTTFSLSDATDVAGNVSVTTTATAGSVTITYNQSYTTAAPIVVITPTNSAAATDISFVYVTSTAGSFTINFNAPSLASAHTYSYHVIETQ